MFSDEDADEMLVALMRKGFKPPIPVSFVTDPLTGKNKVNDPEAWIENRNLFRDVIDGTTAWARYRIY